MDEPFSSLDAELRAAVRADFRRLQREAQVTTVFVTHDREDAAALADEVIEMRDGRLGAPGCRPCGRDGHEAGRRGRHAMRRRVGESGSCAGRGAVSSSVRASLKIEPAVTFGNLFGAPRVADNRQQVSRGRRESSFEVVVALGMPTRLPWLEVTAETIVQPFARDATPELELEANLVWLPSRLTRGWVSSHADIVDKYSPAERPTDRSAYTHKLNLEARYQRRGLQLAAGGRWLKDVELEVSLDFVATGLARRGDPG